MDDNRVPSLALPTLVFPCHVPLAIVSERSGSSFEAKYDWSTIGEARKEQMPTLVWVGRKSCSWASHRIVEVSYGRETGHFRFKRVRKGKYQADSLCVADAILDSLTNPVELQELSSWLYPYRLPEAPYRGDQSSVLSYLRGEIVKFLVHSSGDRQLLDICCGTMPDLRAWKDSAATAFRRFKTSHGTGIPHHPAIANET